MSTGIGETAADAAAALEAASFRDELPRRGKEGRDQRHLAHRRTCGISSNSSCRAGAAGASSVSPQTRGSGRSPRPRTRCQKPSDSW